MCGRGERREIVSVLRSRNIRLFAALFAANAIALVNHAYNGAFSRFMADDYCSAGVSAEMGILGATVYRYQNWSNRYSANLLDSLSGLIGPSLTPYLAGGALLIWLLILSGAVRRMVASPGAAESEAAEPWRSLSIAGALIVAALLVTPAVIQSLYWGQGMRSVVPPLICGSMFLWLAGSYRDSNGIRPGLLSAAGLTTFIAGGFNETFAATQIVLLVIALVALLLYARGSRSGRVVLAGLCGALLALLVVMVAPGNKIRQSHFPPSPDLFGLMNISAWNALRFVSQLPKSLNSVIAISGVLGIGALTGYLAEHRFRYAAAAIWLLPIATVGIIWVTFVPAAYGMSGPPPSRNLIIVAFIFCSAVFSWGWIVGQLVRESAIALHPTSLIVAVLVLVSIAAYAAVVQSDHRKPLREYARSWDRMDAAARQARANGKTEYLVPRLVNPAGLEEIGTDSRDWVNTCASDYYGLSLRTYK